jgi:DNA processing protein
MVAFFYPNDLQILKDLLPMSSPSETEAIVILSTLPGIGPIKIRQLIDHFGTAPEALMASQNDIANLPGFDKIAPHWSSWRTNTSWRNDLACAQKSDTAIIPFTSPQYPKSLLNIPDHPAALYVRGTLTAADTQRSIAIVGTRQASIYGLEMADMLAHALASRGFTIISGLARGIDTAAHCGALKCGRTLAVIGSGLDDIYPPENRGLAAKITQHGALISEFPMNTPPDRQKFPQRNRIVSGMSSGVLLIEAPVKSGAMITMDKATGHKKKLFAIPGRADMETFRGNHLLIKSGRAHLVETAEDILRHYEDLFSLAESKPIGASGGFPMSGEEKGFLEKLPAEELGIEAIVRLTGIPMNKLNSILMGLLLKKRIKEFPGKIYKKTL